MVTMQEIQTLVDEIASGYKPEKIYLFGSYANGTPTEDSDIDLFILKDTNTRKVERRTEVRKSFNKYPPVGVDIIVYTPKELKNVQNDVVNIALEAIKTGKLLYEGI